MFCKARKKDTKEALDGKRTGRTLQSRLRKMEKLSMVVITTSVGVENSATEERENGGNLPPSTYLFVRQF